MISRALLQKRLAACCIILPDATSLYYWHKRVVKSREVLLLVKTIEKKRMEAEREIKKLHSYKIPFIGTVPVSKINKEYLLWAKKSIR